MNVPVRTRRRRSSRIRLQQAPQSTGQGDLVDLEVVLGILRDGRGLIVKITLACLALTYAYLAFVPPSYEADTQIILDTRQESATPVENVVSNLNVSNAVVAGEVVSIRSNVMVGRIVDRLDLVEHPAFDPRRPKPEHAAKTAIRTLLGAPAPHERAAQLSPEELRGIVIEDILSRLWAEQIGISYGIRLSFVSHDPEAAQLVANAVAQEYIDSQLDLKAEVTTRTNSWLSSRIDELSREVEAADAAVVEFRTNMATDAGGGEETTTQLMTELNTRLVATTAERADAEVRYAQVEALLAAGGLSAVADVVTSPLLEALDRERAGLEAERAELATTFGRRHPDMVHLTAQIEEIDRSIAAEIERRVEAMRSDVRVAVSREEALRRQIDDVESRADEISFGSVRLAQLEREAEATRAVYEEFLSRYKETSARGDFQLAEARIVSEADRPTAPRGPDMPLMLASTGVFGLAIGVALVFLRSVLMSPVRTSKDLRRISGAPCLALVPHVGGLWGGKRRWLRRELGPKHRISPFMEAIRTLETHVFGVTAIRRPRALMITSSIAQEGKSSLTYALAKVLSEHGKRVAILDADLRRPDSVQALRLDKREGCLVEALSEEQVTPRRLIKHSELLGADVVAPVRSAQNPVELLSRPGFGGIVTYLMTRYDVLLINAPPTTNLSDTLILSQHADATLFAVKSSAVPQKVIEAALTKLDEAGAFLCGTVMTQVKRGHLAGGEVYDYAYY